MPDEAERTSTQITHSQINAPVTTGDNNQITIYHLEEGAVVHVHGPEAKPTIQPLPLPRDLRAQPFAGLQGRESEVAVATSALAAGQVVEVFGPAGVGKTALLRFLEYEPVADRFPDGVIHLFQGALPILDQLQALYDGFFTADVPYKPTESAARQALREKRALVVVDDAERSREELEQVRGWLPAATFVFASAERRLFGEGAAIPLEGLKNQAALALLERELGRPLTAAEWRPATALCEALKGHPLRLKEAAVEVRAGAALADLVSQAQSKVAWSKLLTLSQAEVMDLLEQVDEGKMLLDALRAGGPADEGWTGTVEKVLAAQQALLQAKKPERADDRALLLFLSVGLAKDAGLWQPLLSLVQSASEFLLSSRLWATWQSLVESALLAATRLGDQAAEAWALHQLGAHALCLSQVERAHSFLTQAEALRVRLGDEAGLKVTRQNLQAVQALSVKIPPSLGRPRRPWAKALRAASLLAVAAVTGVVLGTQWQGQPERRPIPSTEALLTVELAQLDFGVGELQAPVERTVVLRNQGGAPAEVGGVQLKNAQVFHLANQSSCAQLQPGKSCTLQLRFVPLSSGRHTDSLTVAYNANQHLDLDLAGVGRESPTAKPQLRLTPDTLDFGMVALDTSSTKTVRLTNTGDGPLVLDEGTSTLADFTVQPRCARLIAPQESCVVAVTFQPSAEGSRSGSVTLRGLPDTLAGDLKVTGMGGLPDLVVTEFVAGGRVGARVAIQNRGTAPAPVFKVAVFTTQPGLASNTQRELLVPFTVDGDAGQPTPFTKGPLGPGETVVLQGLLPVGTGTLVVEADSCFAEPPSKLCRVREADESNNRRTLGNG